METRNNELIARLQKISNELNEVIEFLKAHEEWQTNQSILKESENIQSEQTTSKLQEVDLELEVTEMIRELSVPDHFQGYNYLRYAIIQAYYNPSKMHITKDIYPEVAKKFHTTPTRAERSIRHAIEKSFNNSTPDVLETYFSNSVSLDKGKPTNAMFINTLADMLKLKYPL